VSIVYKGRRVTLEVGIERLPNHLEVSVERIVFPRVVSILPMINGDLVLIKQYRPVLRDYIIEAPAGTVREGESDEDAARRELLEEAGFIAGNLVKIFEGYVSPGYSTEVSIIYLAPNPKEGKAMPEPHEVIEVLRIPIEEALGLVRRGVIRDLRTVMAILYVAFSSSHHS